MCEMQPPREWAEALPTSGPVQSWQLAYLSGIILC
jgi:hypothetical protein